MKIQISNPNELNAAALQIISFAGSEKTFLFYGDMGAGKTTLIKALCKHIGTNDNVTSPTFSIVNEYNIQDGSIYHFDFYRLKTQAEALDMGFEEYLYSGNYCFIEWPEKIPDLLPGSYISIKIMVADTDIRQVNIEQI